MDFIYLKRGFSRTMILLPGWAFDAGIFPVERLKYDIVMPDGPLSCDCSVELSRFMQKTGLYRTDLMGWSLGSISAIHFAKRHQELVERLILISARDHYPEEAISDLAGRILRNRQQAMKRFYLTAFYSQMEDYRKFKKKHFERLMDTWPVPALIEGLRFILQCPILPYNFEKAEILNIHGRNDIVAPFDSMPKVTSSIKTKTFIMEGVGHLPFLKSDFYEIIRDF